MKKKAIYKAKVYKVVHLFISEQRTIDPYASEGNNVNSRGDILNKQITSVDLIHSPISISIDIYMSR